MLRHLLLATLIASSCTLPATAAPPRAHMRLRPARKHARHAAVAAQAAPDAGLVATGLSYLVGAGSLLLYTPIAVRTVRQGSADGLTVSTWWLKMASYTASDVYAFSSGYPIAQYVETLIITVEAAAILLLVSWYQRRFDSTSAALAVAYVSATLWALTLAPPSALAFAQGGATLLNTGALLPQIALNAREGSAGDYSPVTASLACAGCSIRIFTTYELAGGDPLLLAGFVSGLLVNGVVLAQVLYYGVVGEGKSVLGVLASDFVKDGGGERGR